jgi:hypothetical protein
MRSRTACPAVVQIAKTFQMAHDDAVNTDAFPQSFPQFL